MNFGRTEVIIGASKAKFCRESFGEVRFCVAPQKPGKNRGKLVFETKKCRTQNFWCRKIKCWESSETRFPKFSSRTERSERGKRPFKVFETNRNSRSVFPVFLGHRRYFPKPRKKQNEEMETNPYWRKTYFAHQRLTEIPLKAPRGDTAASHTLARPFEERQRQKRKEPQGKRCVPHLLNCVA